MGGRPSFSVGDGGPSGGGAGRVPPAGGGGGETKTPPGGGPGCFDRGRFGPPPGAGKNEGEVGGGGAGWGRRAGLGGGGRPPGGGGQGPAPPPRGGGGGRRTAPRGGRPVLSGTRWLGWAGGGAPGVGGEHQVGESPPGRRRRAPPWVGVVRLRDDQDVGRRSRADVAERQAVGCLGHHRGRHLAGHDPAEQAVRDQRARSRPLSSPGAVGGGGGGGGPRRLAGPVVVRVGRRWAWRNRPSAGREARAAPRRPPAPGACGRGSGRARPARPAGPAPPGQRRSRGRSTALCRCRRHPWS